MWPQSLPEQPPQLQAASSGSLISPVMSPASLLSAQTVPRLAQAAEGRPRPQRSQSRAPRWGRKGMASPGLGLGHNPLENPQVTRPPGGCRWRPPSAATASHLADATHVCLDRDRSVSRSFQLPASHSEQVSTLTAGPEPRPWNNTARSPITSEGLFVARGPRLGSGAGRPLRLLPWACPLLARDASLGFLIGSGGKISM